MTDPDTSTKELLICPDTGLEHRIGQNAVDSGHGARPSGPQICLNCRETLQSLFTQALQSAKKDCEREARIDELERICELSKGAYKNYLGDWPLFNRRIARLKAHPQEQKRKDS